MATNLSSGAPAGGRGRRSAAQIESDLEAARTRLSASIEELIDQVYPERIKQRVLARVHVLVEQKKAQARALVIDEYGDVRTTRLAMVGAGVAGLIGFVSVIKAIAHRGK